MEILSSYLGTMPTANEFSSTSVKVSTLGRYPKRKRSEVNYKLEDSESYGSTDSEAECVPVIKRPRRHFSSKPLPKRKIFPFLSLPPELRNKIYDECLNDAHTDPSGDEDAIWFQATRRSYRRSVKRVIPEKGDWDNVHYGDRFGGHRYHYARRARAGSTASDDSDSEEDAGHKTLIVNLLAVCKQIHAEAAPLIYSRRLIFADPSALAAFAAPLSPLTVALIRNIEVRSWGMSRTRKFTPYLAMTLLSAKGVTKLEKLNLYCLLDFFHSWGWRNNHRSQAIPKRVARKVYRDCFPWLEAMVADSNDPQALYAGIDILKIHEANFNRWTKDGNENGLDDAMDMYRKELRRLMRRY